MRSLALKQVCSAATKRAGKRAQERGFTLLETTIAFVIMMVVCLGSASMFAYAVRNNSGGSERAQALAIAQQQVERLRQQSFSTSGGTSAQLNAGTTTQNVDSNGLGSACTGARLCYAITTTIVDTSSTLKTITVTVVAQNPATSWSSASNPVTLVTQRSKSS